MSIVKAVVKSNEKRKSLLTKRINKILGNNLKNKKITFLGVTFKPNTDDMRESSSLIMIPYLSNKGALVRYYDPSGKKNIFSKLKNTIFCKNMIDACENADLIIIHTEWDEFKAIDFSKLNKNKKPIIYDLRNLYSSNLMKNSGFKYFSVGR